MLNEWLNRRRDDRRLDMQSFPPYEPENEMPRQETNDFIREMNMDFGGGRRMDLFYPTSLSAEEREDAKEFLEMAAKSIGRVPDHGSNSDRLGTLYQSGPVDVRRAGDPE